MSFAKSHNKDIEPQFEFIIPDSHDYANLEALFNENPDQVHTVRAIYINEGKYGEQPIIATDHALVNAPAHLMRSVRGILATPKSIKAIDQGLAGFKVYTYENKYGTNYSLKWVDVKN